MDFKILCSVLIACTLVQAAPWIKDPLFSSSILDNADTKLETKINPAIDVKRTPFPEESIHPRALILYETIGNRNHSEFENRNEAAEDVQSVNTGSTFAPSAIDGSTRVQSS